MNAILGVLACAILFALFGLLRPAEKGGSCTGNCGACGHGCALSDVEKPHD